ncbi:peptidoglycan-binding protein [Fischerella sp. PCC 9605]|uniref:peptidoglycan-binding protein n=1 Tax=Fischerella sp. PCC 9605 TaxID=1173024 RepID=UPI0004BB262A
MTATQHPVSQILELAQANSTNLARQPILKLGSTGDDVKILQTQLKELGYYDSVIDGQYGPTTRNAVLKFQQDQGLVANGIAGTQTQNLVQAEVEKKLNTANPTPQPTTNNKQSKGRGLVWWLLVAIGVLGTVGALLYFMKWFGKSKKVVPSQDSSPETITQTETQQVQPPLQELDATPPNPQAATTSQPPKLLPPTTTSRLAKVNIVDELLKDLGSPDPTKRRKAIWDLGQQGDSRAIQPLVDLMIDADSQQRSLILAALTEIGIRTLKPMNQALAMSLQHESPQVRQNAIRDLTRIYDMMAQISQMLCHAVQDPDAEVQATARYALAQMNRIRSLPSQDKPSKNSRQELKKLD